MHNSTDPPVPKSSLTQRLEPSICRTTSHSIGHFSKPLNGIKKRSTPPSSTRCASDISGCEFSFSCPSDLARHEVFIEGPKLQCHRGQCCDATCRVDKMTEDIRKLQINCNVETQRYPKPNFIQQSSTIPAFSKQENSSIGSPVFDNFFNLDITLDFDTPPNLDAPHRFSHPSVFGMPTNLLDAFQHLHKAKFTHATIELCGIGVWINDMFEDSGWESWQGPLDCTSVTTDDIDLAEIHATTPVRSFEHYFYIRGISEDSIDRQIYGLLP